MSNEAKISKQEEHSARRAARDETTDTVLRRDADAETANSVARLRRAKEDQKKRFAQWDSLIASDDFGAFLYSRGLSIRDAWEPLPYDPEAELSVLGAMMIDASTTSLAIPPLRPEHFRDESVANVFRAIEKLRDHAVKKGYAPRIDIVTVASAMRRLRTFDDGTTALLSRCVETCPSSANIAAYIEAVLHSARQRYLWFLGQAIAEHALDADAQPDELINNAMRGLDTIQARGMVNLPELFAPSK